MRVLVVDDNSVFREELSDFLLSEGHLVETAPSAGRAEEILAQGHVDVVLTDLKMPKQTGIDLLRSIRERWPTVRTVMITGHAAVDSAVEAMKLGAFDYIAKPFRTEQIREVLRLAEEERAFVAATDARRHPEEVLERLAPSATRPILWAASAPPPARPNVLALEFDGQDLARLRSAVLAHLEAHPGGGVFLPEADRMFRAHRREDVVAVLTDLRDRLADAGPLVLGLDPAAIDEESARALRAVVAAPAVHGALDAVANPIRRRILARLAAGPASFTETMHAAGLDDSPKMSFHLHRLVEVGLIARQAEEYRLTSAGTDVVATLHRLEDAAARSDPHDFVFAVDRTAPAKPKGAGRSARA